MHNIQITKAVFTLQMKKLTGLTLLILWNLICVFRADIIPMDANTIEKYVTQIRNLPIANPLFTNHYQMVASKMNVSILPDKMKLKTLKYVFTSIGLGGVQVIAPKILVNKNQQTSVTWVNNIEGKPILPVDTTINHMIPKQIYTNQVPMIPHLHGLTTVSGYDGRPSGWFTRSGLHGPEYASNSSVLKNTATFIYENDNLPGLHYYHDHTVSITRLNVISGLIGVYQIAQNASKQQTIIKGAFGDLQTVQLLVSDIRLQQNGSIYYHDKADIPTYTYWIPQYFGDIMLVNGRSWPFFKVETKSYRLKIMNVCNSRYLNIYFQDSKGNRLKFNILKMDTGYLNQPTQKQELMLISFSRVQLVIDFSKAVGDVILRNNANTPYPGGDQVDPNLDGQIMKFKVSSANNQETIKITQQIKPITYQIGIPYPKYDNAIKLPFAMIQLSNQNDDPLRMLFNGQDMNSGKLCQNRVFKRGQTYDLYIFNPTADAHPVHIHLVTIQLVGRYKISQGFMDKFQQINGGIPVEGLQECAQFPKIEEYIQGDMILPKPQQMSERDVIDSPPGQVTIIRLSMVHQGGQIIQQKYNGAYPIHCHMLQHQDNDLMCFFHLVNERKCFKQNSLTKKYSGKITEVRQVTQCQQLQLAYPDVMISFANDFIEKISFLHLFLLLILLISLALLIYLIKKYIEYKKRAKSGSKTSPVNLVQQIQQSRVQSNQKKHSSK